MDSMLQEHRRCDLLLASAEEAFARADWVLFRARVAALREALLAHFETEEGVVFPQFEQRTGLRAPTADLCTQHKGMRKILEALASASPAHDPEGCGAELATFALLYRQHREREEGLLYPAFAAPGAAPMPMPAMAPVEPALDLRGLEPPQPIVRIFEALQRAPGEPLRVVLPHEPQPLYGLLRERGFEWSGAQRADGGFDLTIRRAGEVPTSG